MTTEWTIYEEPEGLYMVLVHPSGAKAFFSSFRIGDVMMKARLFSSSLPKNPFETLALLIRHGLRPSKIEGDTSVFAQIPPLAFLTDGR